MSTTTQDLLNKLKTNEYPASYIIKCALKLRTNPDAAESLLKIALNKLKQEGRNENEAYIFLTALHLNKRTNITEFLKKLENSSDLRVSILRGYNFYLQKSYEDALHEFSKAGYKKGADLCAVALRDKKRIYESGNEVLISCIDSKKWRERNNLQSVNKNYLYRLGITDEFDNKECLDVKLRDLEKSNKVINGEITDEFDNKECLDVKLRDLEKSNKVINGELINSLKKEAEKVSYKAEISYILGKIYHKKGQLEKAGEFYSKSLREDSEFLPSLYNLCRLNRKKVLPTGNYEELEDYNALIDIIKGRTNFNIDGCSREMRRNLLIAGGSRKSLKEMEMEVENKKSIFSKAILLNNIGVLKREASYFERALKEESDELRKNYIKYNLGIEKKDIQLLKESNIPESSENISLINYEKNKELPTNQLLAGCLLAENGEEEKSVKLLEGISGENLIRDSFLSAIYSKRGEIEKVVSAASQSFYCMNSLAVSFAEQGSYRKSLLIYKQLENDLVTDKFDEFREQLYCNIGNVYVLSGNYQKAVSYYSRSNMMSDEILEYLGKEVRDIKLLEKIIVIYKEKHGNAIDKLLKFFYKLKIMKLAEISLKQARMFAEEVNMQQEVKKELFEREEEERQRREKIKEIEELRKRRKESN
ncbi:hypothetical protein NUSPORA_02174 [Nucleospora cyclopteri]